MACLFYFPDFLTEHGNVGFGFLTWQSKGKTGVGSGERKIVDSGMRMKLKKRYWNKTLKKRYLFHGLLMFLFFLDIIMLVPVGV